MQEDFEKLYHDIEKKHFWFASRRSYIIGLLKTFPKNCKILDIGCSSGILLNEISALGFDKENLFGIDISEKAIINCKANGIKNSYVMDAQNIQLNTTFDIIIASDCLEHLENDNQALKNWHQLLSGNGTLMVFVPAFMSLWSNHDVVNMHYRRYTKDNLEEKLLGNGFLISKSSYWNFSLFIPVFIIRLLSRLSFLNSSTTSHSGNLDKPSIFNILLLKIINLENRILKHINFPFGISTFCIAKKAISKILKN